LRGCIINYNSIGFDTLSLACAELDEVSKRLAKHSNRSIDKLRITILYWCNSLFFFYQYYL